MYSLKIKNDKGVVLEIDLSNAYDRFSWIYIRLLLTELGFEVPFINWIMECITLVSFAVLINGITSPFYLAERGLRQGCPLSPLLFVIVVEGLSRLFLSSKDRGEFHKICTSQGSFVTHLFFVDDVIIFVMGPNVTQISY